MGWLRTGKNAPRFWEQWFMNVFLGRWFHDLHDTAFFMSIWYTAWRQEICQVMDEELKARLFCVDR